MPYTVREECTRCGRVSAPRAIISDPEQAQAEWTRLVQKPGNPCRYCQDVNLEIVLRDVNAQVVRRNRATIRAN